MPTNYPFDPTGSLVSNKITGEQHIITPANHKDYNFIVPKLAPFFANSLAITFRDQNNVTVNLVEGIDWYLSHWFISASRACSAPIYGSISLLNRELSGVITISYQTLGGDWNINESLIAQILADRLHNPRTTSWDSVSEMPYAFPVIDHEWDLVDMVGMSGVVEKLQSISNALLATGEAGVGNHILDTNNPHNVTAAQVGLGLVSNFGVSTRTEAEEGNVGNKYMTPQRVRQAIEKQVDLTPITTHVNDLNNPHNVTAAQIGLGKVPNYDVATAQEAEEGILNNKFMTPLGVAKAISSLVGNDTIEGHVTNRDNPHNVTAEQIGLGLVRNFDIASQADAEAGLRGDLYMTPARTRNAIESYIDNNSEFDDHIDDTNNPHSVTAEQVGTLTTQQINDLLLGKLGTDDTAYDTERFGGYLPGEYITEVLKGTAHNSDRLAGRTIIELINEILSGTAYNTHRFSGMDYDDMYNWVKSLAASSVQSFRGSFTNPNATNLWTPVAAVRLQNKVRAHCIIVGGDDINSTVSSSSYINISFDGTTLVDFHVKELLPKSDEVSYGYSVIQDSDGGGVFEALVIWVKSSNNRQNIHVTNLSTGAIDLLDGSSVITISTTEPANIVYNTDPQPVLVEESTLIDFIDELADTFESLALN